MYKQSFNSVAIIGAGSWGSALAYSLTHCTFEQITLFTQSSSQAKELAEQRTNRHYLEDFNLPQSIQVTTSLEDCAGADLILIVVPSSSVNQVAAKLADLTGLNPTAVLINCAKGIDNATGRRMSEVILQHLPSHPVAVLSGPNHAEEVSRDMPAAAVIGCADLRLARQLQQQLSHPRLRLYSSEDIIGIELGGAIKNTFAIAAGIAKGLGLGDNATAALVTRGLAELTRLGEALGGQASTFVGLSGVGDLMVTCYSEHSRNNRVGRALGQGGHLEEITERLGMVAEGVPNTEAIYHAAQKAKVRTPLINAVYAILYQQKPPAKALEELLTRDLRHEQE